MVELLDLFKAVEQRIVAQRVELVAAEIVAAALHVADLQRAEQGLEERNVFEEELLLKVFRPGRDDDALLALAGHAQGGQEIGQGLARSRSCLDDQVALVFEGLFDGSRHLVLAFAVLKGQRRAREDAARREEVVQIRQILRRGWRDRDGRGRGQVGLRKNGGTESRRNFYNRQVANELAAKWQFWPPAARCAGESWTFRGQKDDQKRLGKKHRQASTRPKKGRAPKVAPTTGAVDPRKRKMLAAKKAAAEKAASACRSARRSESTEDAAPRRSMRGSRSAVRGLRMGLSGRQTPRSSNEAGREQR